MRSSGAAQRTGTGPPGAAGTMSTALRVLAVAFASGALLCLGFAVAGMVTGGQSARTGYLLRVGALACFGAAVALNVIAH